MALIRPIFSYEHVAQMPDDGKRYEIVDGDLVVSPSPKRRHQRAVGILLNFLIRAQQAGCGEAYVAPFHVVFDPHNVTEPDLLFISRGRLGIVTEDNVQGAPDLVVEVLSESTRDRDLGAKLRLYARNGVQFYWVVDPDAQTLQSYELQAGGYREGPALSVGATLACPLFPGLDLAVGEVFGA